jgi:non-ribosomal peptide synthetase component F
MDGRPDVRKWLTDHHVVWLGGDELLCRVPDTAVDWTMFEEIVQHPGETEASAREQRSGLAARHALAPAHLDPPPVHRQFEVHAQLNPGARAVKSGQCELTYGELDCQADSLAAALQGEGLGPHELCAVCMQGSLAMVRAVLAVLKAGGACLMLDPAQPHARLVATLGTSGAKTVITQRTLADRFAATNAHVICNDDDSGDLPCNWPQDCPTDGVSPACAVCRYSESDAPTIVIQQHTDVLDRLASMQEISPIAQGDSLLQGASNVFDTAVWELLWPLTHGARLVIQPTRERMNLERMRELVAEERITVMHVNLR